MIVEWTTITEDESTWPPIDIEVALEYLNSSFGFTRKCNYPIIGLKGRQWRPMPKPRKKKSNFLEEIQKIYYCKAEVADPFRVSIASKLQFAMDLAEVSKPAWRDPETFPRNEEDDSSLTIDVIVKHHNSVNGSVRFSKGYYSRRPHESGWMVYTDNGVVTHPILGWMEAPQ